MAFAQEIIDKIAGAADIVEVIGEYVTLKKKGANYWGCCPFHNEKTASFSVSPAKQIYKCFGCGEGGNIFKFLEKHENLSFPQALRWLGKKYNIDVPERELTPEEREKEKQRESLEVVMSVAGHFYRDQILNRRPLEYLNRRGFSPDDSGGGVLERFGVGYAPDGNVLLDTLVKQGYNVKLLEDNSLICDRGKGWEDKFRDRIMFPILSLTGKLIGFQSRRIDDTKNYIPKYCNSDNTQLFRKGNAIFGLYQAKKEIGQQDKVYWVEGQFDVLSFVQAGIANTVCGSGTAMTEEQIHMLLRFTRNVTLVYDGDAAGIKAAKKNIALLADRGAAVRVITLPDGEDPDSFARKMSPENLRKFITNNEIDFVNFLVKIATSEMQDPERKAEILDEIIELIGKLRLETLQAVYVKKAAELFALEDQLIWRQLREIGRALPDEQEIKETFYGIEESQELLRESKGICELTCNFDVFTKHFGTDPVVYFKGTPSADEIQKFCRLVNRITFGQTELLKGDEQEESSQLLVLKDLFRHGMTVDIVDWGSDDDSAGLVQYYVSMYGRQMDRATETQRAIYVDRCAELISYANDTVRTVMAKALAKTLGLTLKQYQDVLKPYIEQRRAKSAINMQRLDMDDTLMAYNPEKLPDYVEENEDYMRVYQRYGFYPLLNKQGDPVCYMFKSDKGGGHIQVADFYMIPLLHIYDQDSEFNKRVIKINRLYSKEPIYLEVKSKSLVSLPVFEEILMNEEALNFENGENKHFRKIRQAMSYNYTKCSELNVFGQQNENFFAFANAIFHEVDGMFRVDYADELGVMSHEGKNYYTPAYSKIYSGLRKDADKYEQHRYFVYKDIPEASRCTFEQWAALMDEVYKVNDNGKWAVIYAIMCAFRSDIHTIDRLFTALFFVGPTMSGKTQIAISIRSLYVSPQAPSFNLNSGTDAAFFTLMEGFRDVPQVLEEYNNKDISKDKFQGLKAITYDGDGKQKRKGVNNKELDTSKVNSPVVILGQETPERDDNALMNRVVLGEVPKRNEEYTAREIEVFQKLKESEKTGLCNVLFEILKLRSLVREHFKNIERKAEKELTEAVLAGSEGSGDMVRIIKTISLFLAMCKLLEDYAPALKLPFTYDRFFELAKDKVKWQIELISHTDKLAGFFKAIEVMVNLGTIKEGRDYVISQPGRLTLKAAGGDTKQVELSADTKVLFIRLSNLYALYGKSSYNTEAATLSTIEQNLRSNPTYIGVISSKKFKWMEASEVPRSEVSGDMEMRRVMVDKVQTTSCIALNYDVFRNYFDIDLERDVVDEALDEESVLKPRHLDIKSF